MPTSVLLSIKPEFADAILEGRKRFEFRKAGFKAGNIERVYIYASSPISMVIGEFELLHVIESEPDSLWKETKDAAGISREYFRAYFSGRTKGYALVVGSTAKYAEPKSLKEMFGVDRPPQSFRYVRA